MMRNTALAIIACSIFISSCSINKSFDGSKHSPMTSDTAEQESQQPCVYREVKGISEVINIDHQFVYFRFYPGDDAIAVRSETIADVEYLQIGDELMARKKYLVNGSSNDCVSVELILKQP